MHRLSSLDQTHVLAAVRDVYQHTCVDALRTAMVQLSSDLIGGEFGSFNLLSKGTSRLLASVRFPDVSRIVEPHLPAFIAYFHEHPMLRFAQRTGRLDAQRFSDVVSRSEWESTRLHNEYLRPIGIRRQMIVSFDRPDRSSVAVSINRANREFSARDVTVFNLLRPHFAQAYENVVHLEQARAVVNRLERLDASGGRGILVIDSHHRIRWISQVARDALRQTLQNDVGVGALLPDQLRRWLDVQRRNRNDIDGMRLPPGPWRSTGGEANLVIQLGTEDQDGNVTLLLTLEPTSRNRPQLPELTARENEVLRWIAGAKTNPEIAHILGLSVRTIYKHVENIFRKLGVENRAGAMLRARQSE